MEMVRNRCGIGVDNIRGTHGQRSGQVVVYGLNTSMGYAIRPGALVCRMLPSDIRMATEDT